MADGAWCARWHVRQVWLGGARLEAAAGNFDRARAFLTRALQDAPQKTRAAVRIEQARLEEYAGDVDAARTLLAVAKKESKHEWKVFLEAVMLEMRGYHIEAAIAEAWAALQVRTLSRAQTASPWCLLVGSRRLLAPARR